MASTATASSPSRSRPPPDPPPSFSMCVVVVRASPLESPDLSIIFRAVSSFPLSTTLPLSSFAVFVFVVVGSKPPKPPKPPELSLTFSVSLYSLDCTIGLLDDSPLVIVHLSPAVCRPVTLAAVCSSTAGVFRLCSLILWQLEGFMSDITFFPANRVFLDSNCLTSIFMELVLPKCSLVLRSSVAGCLMLKIRDISIYVLIKGSTNWCLITFTFVANYVIVKCAFVEPLLPIPSCWTDGAWKESTRSGGMGWIIKNEAGELLCRGSKSRSHVSSSLMAEALSVYEALKKASELNLRSLQVFSDSQVLVFTLCSGLELNEIAGVLQDIKILAALFTPLSFSFISRSVNAQADTLARSSLANFLIVV